MTSTLYPDAVAGALERLQGVGFEFGRSFVNHAPMAAEALAHMGYGDVVPTWVEGNLRSRHYHEVPAPRWPLRADNAEEWGTALGDFGRVADWSQMFARELTERPWRDVLTTWWPRLLPGMSGMLTHGVIRTAHAVRAIDAADDDLRRGELSNGLAYLASRYSRSGARAMPRPAAETGDDTRTSAIQALDELAAASADRYARTAQTFPVPLVHTITGPAAVRLLCEYLPAEQAWSSYLAAREANVAIWGYFPASATRAPTGPAAPLPSGDEIIAAAVEVGDEHAIKLAEVAVRRYAAASDTRLLAASAAATDLIRRFPA